MSRAISRPRQVLGYTYWAGIHMAVCHGPVDEVSEILVGERSAWSGAVSTSAQIRLDKPEMFGGVKREGGVAGLVDLMFGESTQAPNAYLASRCAGWSGWQDAYGCPVDDAGQPVPPGFYGIPNTAPVQSAPSGLVPAFRGILSVVVKRCALSAMNPYIKPWSFRVKRLPRPFGTDYADINGDANPAWIVAECLTNADWGMGYPVADLDLASFTVAAKTLYDEGFGLSLAWGRQTTILDFIQTVLNCVNGALVSDLATGAFQLRLVRADYDPDALLTLDASNVVSLSRFSRPTPGELVNQITLEYTRRDTGKTASLTLQDIASIASQGGVSASTVSFPGVRDADLARRLACRELSQISRALAKATLVVNRQAAGLQVGDAFRLVWPDLGIESLIMRVINISYGLLTDGRIKIDAVEDVFSLPDTAWIGASGSSWVDPIQTPQPLTTQAVFELPYWSVVRGVTGESDLVIGDLPAGYGFYGLLAARSQQQSTGFEVVTEEPLWTIDPHTGQKQQTGTEWQTAGAGSYTAWSITTSAQDDSATVLPLQHGDLSGVAPGDLGLWDGEAVCLVELTPTTATVVRAVADTVPQTHAAGSRIWWVGDNLNAETDRVYLAGQTATARLLPVTSRGTLAATAAISQTITFASRAERPYPPGNIRVGGSYRPSRLMGDGLPLAWATRNRLTQTDDLIGQLAGSISPEPGATISVRLWQKFSAAGDYVLSVEQAGLTGDSFTPSVPLDGCWLKTEIWSERDGLASWQTQRIETERAGYGINYGNYYGGFA